MFKSEKVENNKCSTGIDQPVAVLLVYLFGWISGLIFYLVEKENRFVRFCAMQSILINAVFIAIWIVLSILSIIPFLGLIFLVINILLCLGILALVIVLIIQGYQGTKISLPIIGSLAETWSAKSPE